METKKLNRVVEAGKLKFSGNKNQFLFTSELSGTLDVTHFWTLTIQKKRGEKVAELKKTLQCRQVIKLADKSEAGWLAVKEYQTEELVSDSKDENRIRKAQELVLEKKQNAAKKPDRDRSLCIGASRPHTGDDRMRFQGRRLPSQTDTCFRCDRKGHWSADCGQFGGYKPGNFRVLAKGGLLSSSGDQPRKTE